MLKITRTPITEGILIKEGDLMMIAQAHQLIDSKEEEETETRSSNRKEANQKISMEEEIIQFLMESLNNPNTSLKMIKEIISSINLKAIFNNNLDMGKIIGNSKVETAKSHNHNLEDNKSHNLEEKMINHNSEEWITNLKEVTTDLKTQETFNYLVKIPNKLISSNHSPNPDLKTTIHLSNSNNSPKLNPNLNK